MHILPPNYPPMYNSSTVFPVVQTLAELPALVDNLLLLLSEKEKVVIKKRFDLDGLGRATLEQIGNDFSVTRERVRQIEKSALGKMKRNVFNTSLRNLHDFVMIVVQKNGGLLRKEALVTELKSVLPPQSDVDCNNLDLSFVLHEGLDCVGNTINFHPYVREKSLPDYSLKHASNQIVNQMHKYGDVKDVNRVHHDMKSVFDEMDFDLTKIKSLIGIDKRLTLVDECLVGLLEWRHIHPRTLRDKVLFVLRNQKKPLHFVEIAEKISGAAFDNREVNLQAVHNELIRHPQFVLIGRGIYALAEWGYERGTVAEVIEKILDSGKEFSQDEIIEMVLEKRRVKKITIVLALKNNKSFVRVGRKRYKLKA